MPQGTANLIKPAKISSNDFEAFTNVDEKDKNVAKYKAPDDKEKETSGNQFLVHS